MKQQFNKIKYENVYRRAICDKSAKLGASLSQIRIGNSQVVCLEVRI